MRLKQINPAEMRRVFEREMSEPTVAGTILRDFETLLDFIGEEGQPVSGQYNLFPLKVLPDLNARLARPLQVDLKRPRLKSYPHLGGLYMLARATGLTHLSRQDNKLRLRVDPRARVAWVGLNPVERYFTLLESWLLRGSPAIIGEQSG
jgi:hypothetical protein